MADALPELDGTVDLVIANPPYIPLDAYASVAPEARDHDPALALFSGPDGLDAIRALVRVAARLLRAGGLLCFEHADVQGEAAPAVVPAAAGFAGVRDHRDLTGRPRFVTAVRRAVTLAGWAGERLDDRDGATPGSDRVDVTSPMIPGYRRFDCTDGDPAVPGARGRPARRSRRGECIVLPTDTVYGIGADAFNAEAVQRLLDAKGRGRDMPPPVLIGEPS